VSGSGISWAICKSAPRSRQITTQHPTTQFFYRPDALPVAQPTVSKHWRHNMFPTDWNNLLKQLCSDNISCNKFIRKQRLFCLPGSFARATFENISCTLWTDLLNTLPENFSSWPDTFFPCDSGSWWMWSRGLEIRQRGRTSRSMQEHSRQPESR